ncbi:hypothetical protein CEXT_424221 [Caerostris extrusa]|uniref:Uncharacterized protein n=1 Tax=Caerostris extrusa TaxID=172846 RepID=A0AAV4PAA1_CAEEX|nr:hypothetical protein CEXT_424221 [Caerostris extrusa]
MADFHKLTPKFFIVIHLELLTNRISFMNKFFDVLVFPEWNPTVLPLSSWDVNPPPPNYGLPGKEQFTPLLSYPAYRAKHSTVDQLLYLSQSIINGLQDKPHS